MRRGDELLWLAIAIGGGAAVAIGAVREPALMAGALAAVLFFVVFRVGLARAPQVFLVVLGVLLLGYAMFGRAFAYLGIRPIFAGEIVLGLGLVALVSGLEVRRFLREPIAVLLIAYMFWGALQTIPYVPRFGIVALRDAVVWGYAMFALLVPMVLLHTGWLKRAIEGYSRVLPWLLLWIPIALWISRFSSTWGVFVPGSPEVNLLELKPGDAAIHLAGAATFLMLGLHAFGRERGAVVGAKEWIWWTLWLGGFILATSANRGGLLSIICAMTVVLTLRPGSRWAKGLLVALLLAGSFLIADVEIDTGSVRKASPQQIAANLVSVFGDAPREGLGGTRRWRQDWWAKIIDDTVFGPHFWRGKGFGLNLAVDDGIVTPRQTEAAMLRSPHNGHLTILARTGVPGLLLWATLNLFFSLSLLQSYFRARREGLTWWARMDLWILAYWAAFMVNTTFDVFLEGPQGGIWFWSLFGFGTAALLYQRGAFHDIEHRRRERISERRAAIARPHRLATGGDA